MLALAALLVVAAPEPETEAGKLLQVAWNSQYEWKEEGVRNVTLDLGWVWSVRSKDGTDWGRSGRAQIVVVEGEVVRRHYPGLADQGSRARLDEHVDWVIARFVRKPFGERFAEAALKGPEDAAGGARKITAGRYALLVKDDRLYAEEVDRGEEGKPFVVRVDYTVADVRGGYTITGASCSYTLNTERTVWKREMKLRDGAKYPAPQSYLHAEDRPDAHEEIRLDFDPPVFDAENPVVLDPAARDLLKTAWEKRYTLPDAVRIEGEFVRKVDNDLVRAGWVNGVRGEFQVWGMKQVQVAVEERWQNRWGGEVLTTCTEHIQAFIRRLEKRPFEEEFAGAGFRMEEAGKERIVHVVGYPKALAFRMEGEEITGHLDRIGTDEGWWTWKVKDTREGWLIDRLSRKVEDQKLDLRFRYGTKKGMQVPTQFDAVGAPRGWGGRGGAGALGVVTYELKKLKVSMPDG